MSENSKFNNPELFRYLSEEEQESLTAGQSINYPSEGNFFFQKTNIQSTADSTLNLGGGDVSSQNTRYNFSQITIGSSIKVGLPIFSQDGNRWQIFISKILNNLFS
ncbi:MAG: hypothetical protein RM347_000685 [Nostoc sp. ChiQUE02]|uniref:hypothetical protein n=1 Tax=Nostoc sp. ChiQUE02 TaxID=3075377 RepID=UPI002AD58188|nr:hypothetical protein [Nostoc sp. ChiQUE02]MDZ8235260.1 hypothetical protein [Nostoc sp. ChiQUE02]